MVTKCACGNINCSRYDVAVPDIRAIEGKPRVCSECGGPMIVTQSMTTPESRKDAGLINGPAFTETDLKETYRVKDEAKALLLARGGSCLLCAAHL
jgi:hypothetical protein